MVNKILFIFKGVLLFYPLFVLFLFIVFCIIKLWYKYKEQQKTLIMKSELPIMVDSLLISNFKKTFAFLILYFSLTIGIILLFRVSILGSYRSVVNIKLETSLMLILLLLSTLILLLLLKKVLRHIATKEVFKVYLYLYSKQTMKNILEYLFHSYDKSKQSIFINQLNNILNHIQPNCTLPFYTRKQYANKEYIISLSSLDKIRSILSKFIWMSCCITEMAYIINVLNDYWWPLRYYFVYFFSFIVLVYDLSNERLYYFYFMLFVILLVTLYRDLLFFIGTKDFLVGDRVLSEYLYKNRSLLLNAYYNENILKDYLSNGYQKRNTSDNLIEQVASANFHFALVRRIYILFGLSILSGYTLFCTSILNILLLTIPLVILFNLMIMPFLFALSKELYHKIFCLISAVLLIINIWVYFIRHNYYYMRDIIWDRGILIEQIFTIEEKRTFLYAYLNVVLDNYTTISVETKGNILTKVTDEALAQYLTENTTIKEIRQYVELLPLYFLELEKKYSRLLYKNNDLSEQLYIINVITKILHWLNDIIRSVL